MRKTQTMCLKLVKRRLLVLLHSFEPMTGDLEVNILERSSCERVLSDAPLGHAVLSFRERCKVMHLWPGKEIAVTQPITFRYSRKKIIKRSQRHHPALADNANTIAEPLRFLDVVS